MEGLKKFYLAAFCYIVCDISSAQPYLNSTSEYFLNYYSEFPLFANGLSLHDFNRDGLDDITLCSSGYGVQTFMNSESGFNQVILFDWILGDLKHPIWVDYDNDGDSDFFVTRVGGTPLLFKNDGNLQFTDISYALAITSEYVISMGCSWGDFDNDGLIDCYVGNYHQENYGNWLFKNNGQDIFQECSAEYGVDNDYKLTYQPLFVDHDLDGDMDLIVVNDRNDGNFFYENVEGDFMDISTESGFNIPCDAMSATTADFDKDGDYDFYISNTELGNQLLRNDNGLFTNIAEQSDAIVNGWCWGAIWIDTYNDSKEELVVTAGFEIEQDNYYLENSSTDLENYYFSVFSEGDTFGEENYCVAKGDLDHNGSNDLVMTSISPVKYSIWTSDDENSGNWLNVSLIGTLSNRDGIGAIAELYIGNDIVRNQWLCGENFMSQNSQHAMIGVGQNEFVDSMLIKWPSGWIDRYYSLQSNQYLNCIEGETIYLSNLYHWVSICPNDSVLLDLSAENNVYWNDGDTSSSRWIYEAGIYIAILTNDFGLNYTREFIVEVIESPSIFFLVNNPTCFGEDDGSVELINQSPIEIEIFWNDVLGEALLSNLSFGEINWEVNFLSGCSLDGTILVAEPDPLSLSYEDTLYACYDSAVSALVNVFGGTPQYTFDWFGFDQNLLNEGEYQFQLIDGNGCIANGEIVVLEYPEIFAQITIEPFCFGEVTSIDVSATGGSGVFNFDYLNFDPQAVLQGEYCVLITDNNSCVLSQCFSVQPNPQLVLNYLTNEPVGGDNGSVSIQVTGGTPPYSFLWSHGDLDSLAENLSQGFYECVISDEVGCLAYFSVNLIDIFVNEKFSNVKLFPSLFNSQITIESSLNEIFFVYDARGNVVKAFNLCGIVQIDTTAWPAGIYIFCSQHGMQLICVKFE